jgi:hypothetical protein
MRQAFLAERCMPCTARRSTPNLCGPWIAVVLVYTVTNPSGHLNLGPTAECRVKEGGKRKRGGKQGSSCRKRLGGAPRRRVNQAWVTEMHARKRRGSKTRQGSTSLAA